MADFYREALSAEAFGTIPMFQDRASRDEEALPLSDKPDGVFFNMQDRGWRVRFNGADRFEVFGLEDYDSANRLYKGLCDERT